MSVVRLGLTQSLNRTFLIQYEAAARFDTEHERDPALAPTHGTILVSHFFFAFGYAVSTKKQRVQKP